MTEIPKHIACMHRSVELAEAIMQYKCIVDWKKDGPIIRVALAKIDNN